MKRDERAALLLMHEAAAKALRESLEDDARQEHEENGVAASWRMGAGTLSASIAKDRVEVLDGQAFLKYISGRHPDEVVTRLEPRNPRLVNVIRAGLVPERDPETGAATGRALDDENTVVPGVQFVRGGRYLQSSWKPDRHVEAVLLEAARYAVATGGEWGPLWAYSDGHDPGMPLAMMRERPALPGRPTDG